MGHSCGTLLWDTLVGHSCGTLLWDTLVLISLAKSQPQWIDLVGHPREEDRSDAKVGMILFTEAHLEYNAGLVISIGSASRPSPIDPASTADTLFCTSADAMCAVCTGHHKKGGNSACLRGQQQSKGDRTTTNKTKTPNTNQPNTPKQTSQSFALYSRVRQVKQKRHYYQLHGP